MKLKTVTLNLALAGIVAFSLSGCGGESTAPGITLTGTAATGAAFTGGTIYVYDSRGETVGTTSTVNATTGSYSLTLAEGAVAPFVLVATRTTADGQTETLVSVVGSTDQTTANITPITSLIASQLSPSGDPTQLATELAAGDATVNTAAISAAVTEINTLLSPLLTATGTNTNDPLTTAFTTDGTNYDRLLDSISVSFTPTSSNTNVDIAVKTALSDTEAPLAISYNTTDVPTSSPLPTIDSSKLVTSGTGAQIQGLLDRLTACFAVPLSERVLEAAIISDTCKGVFHNNTPGFYKHNSYTVGPEGAFKGIFTAPTSANVKFDRPRYEFTVNNGNTTTATKPLDGDVVFTASWSDANGNSDSVEYWARPDSTGKLFLTGNLSGIDAEVSARVERREFLHANLSAYSHINTGFNVFVNSKHTQMKNASDQPVSIAYIVVTTPKGNKLGLASPNNYGYYELMVPSDSVGNFASTNTSVVRLAGKYANGTTEGSPRTVDTKLYWGKSGCTDAVNYTNYTSCANSDWSDTDIAAIPAQGLWTFAAYDSNDNLINTFKRRTTNRPLTLAEASAVKWPTLTSEVKAGIVSGTGFGYYEFLEPDYAGVMEASNGFAWEVPTGATWSPTVFKVYGKDPANGKTFDDKSQFRSTARSAQVKCSDTDGSGTADQHCDATATDKFKTGVRVSQLQLNGRDTNRVQYSVSYRTQNAW